MKYDDEIMAHVDDSGVTVWDRIKQALTETLPDIGQIDDVTKRQLNRLVRQGHLSKGRGGPFPATKTVYAVSGFDRSSIHPQLQA